MINITWSEWLRNQKRIPDPESKEYHAFFEFHKKLCTEGGMMNGVFINPLLYWHLNVWITDYEFIDERGFISSEYRNPDLRDNDWFLSEHIYNALQKRENLIVMGIRQFAKSTWEASFIAHGATFEEASNHVVASLNDRDLNVLRIKLMEGLTRVPIFFRWQTVKKNWNSLVTLGVRKKDNTVYSFSNIHIRNLSENQTKNENLAGLRPRRMVIDEIGKGPWLNQYMTTLPAQSGRFGRVSTVLAMGTGGEIEYIEDARKAFLNPDTYSFIEYKEEKTGNSVGLFIPNKYRQEAKVLSNLGDYLGLPDKELKKVPMYVSDEQKAKEIKENEIEKAKKSGDAQLELKIKAYYPDEPNEIFVTLQTSNIYSVVSVAAQEQIRKIEQEGFYGVPVELYEDETGKVKHRFSSRPILKEYPVSPNQNREGAICIMEFPIEEDPPFGLYVAGVDSYRIGSSVYSKSLGAIYIMKRGHALMEDKFQNAFVAWFVSRYENKDYWNEQARLLLKFYNAYTLVENDEYSFIQYMLSKGDGRLLADSPKWVREIAPTSRVTRDKGISRSSKEIIEYLRTCFKKYLEDVIYEQKDEEGNITRQIRGVNRIFDVGLLREIIMFNEEDNFDREVAASLAVTLSMHLDPIIGKVGSMSPVQRSYRKIVDNFIQHRKILKTKKVGPFSPLYNPFK